ncbi:pantoate--beta-alanine ligase [Rathayibacter sp. YIM 133350]|uniref:pantoate--beta-alanine ligase n=1 Tax=Rathayibacter sp. YIM 133350 TaxID=3131992 RepID=UPI00307FAD4C
MSTTPALITSIEALRATTAEAHAAGRSVALVPTMGALHAGHLALVDAAAAEDRTVIVSIFVNPLQFGAGEDLDTYPRTLDADLAALADRGVTAVFAPSVATMYPHGPVETRVSAGEIGTLYEGASRPGHFDGMLTVVAKLLNIVRPDVVFFGQKDAQQVFLVHRMVRELDVPVDVVTVPTVRESDGLALSSRNRYLDPDQRAAALTLSESLRAAEGASAEGLAEVLAEATAVFGDRDAVKLDYLVVVDPQTFLPITDDAHGPATVLVAARVGTTRLIDNTTITL